MIHRLLPVVVAALLVPTFAVAASAPHCTAFELQRSATVVLGKNLDWELGTGLLVVHSRGDGSGRRYGSVTCNQLGADLPLGGLNEVGLAVEELSYGPARYPDPAGRPTVDELSWIQRQLDRHATVDEVIADLETMAIARRWFGLHYIVADRVGDVAVVEFLDGEPVVHRGEDLPTPVLANDTYANSLRYLREHHGFGGERRETDGSESPERFVRAARGVMSFQAGATAADPVTAAFAILDDVRQDDTQWSVVHDLSRPALHIRVRGVAGTRVVDLNEFDLTTAGPPLALDLTGAIVPSSWTPWTPDLEQELRIHIRDRLGLDRVADLHLIHVQNAGMWVGCRGRSLLVDALFDLTVDDGRPPRLHDHLPADLVAALLDGRLYFGCVDAVFATHGHDDHHQDAAAGRYRSRCPGTPLVLPAAMAPDEDGVVPVAPGFGGTVAGEAGPLRFTSLGLRHGDATDDRPHVGYVFQLDPWRVVHLGDASLSPENLAVLDQVVTGERTVVLAPYWFVTDAAGRAWLRERPDVALVVVQHANRGNAVEVENAMIEYAPELPPLVLPHERLQEFVIAD